ncbi:HAD family hydrolase [Lysinibacillus boronitolerans]|uniref:D-glycero-alpha-D-manno-heptose-1,7-bisphosphate 7-phosphatase n=1 Tax=Lysinibacillus boronitolerans TaxID=309788 RepID=UPI00216209B6|nr:HAD family hydrolase [Lysinibacillus boronitolerans]MCS1394251.1 HAD family hydrolase [Lysinibacillus boronitolerans]
MNKALFLDRDGVINVEKNYVFKIEDFEFIEGIFELIKTFQDKGYLIIVITNQAGIGRGYYTEEDFHKLNDWMIEQFKQRGITITDVYYCPYHPTHGIGEYLKDSYDRKPNPGMILKASERYSIDLKQSVLIGDKDTDIKAGQAAGIPKNLKINNCIMNFKI